MDGAIVARTGHLSIQMRRMYAEEPRRRRAKGVILRCILNGQKKQIKEGNEFLKLKWEALKNKASGEKEDDEQAFEEEQEQELMEEFLLGAKDSVSTMITRKTKESKAKKEQAVKKKALKRNITTNKTANTTKKKEAKAAPVREAGKRGTRTKAVRVGRK